ncbi:MAG: hypothetical protein AMXMBFR64_19160 [Myxococcales bacterium]
MTVRSRLAIALSAATLVACSDDSVTSYNPEDLSVDTGVSALVVSPGMPFDVTCTVSHNADGVVELPTVVLVTPEASVAIADHRVTPNKVGTLSVACALADFPQVYDPTPESVLVTQNAAAGVETVLEPSKIGAGSVSDVRCQPFNQQGAKVEAPTTVAVSPTEGIVLDDHAITGEKVGSYEVTCSLTDAPTIRDSTPALLTVIPGAPAKVTTKLEGESVPAGGTVGITCLVEDAYGNPITDAATSATTSPAEGVTISEKTLSAGKAGTYEITCHVAGKEDAAEVPATLVVEGGKPVAVDLVVDPVKQGYAVGDVAKFSYTVTDAFGNALDVPATFSAPSSGVAKKAELTYELTGEGAHTFTVTLDPPNQAISDSETLMVDATPPTLIITWPPRGQTLTGDQTVTVTGEVHDAVAGVKQVNVNGGLVTPAADGTFSFQIKSAHGLNPVLAEATDKAGNYAKATVAYYFSSDYMPFEGVEPPAVALDDSLRMFLSQDIIDDGVHDPAHVDDLATLVEILIANVDLTQLGIGQVFQQSFPVINQPLGSFNIPIINQQVNLALTGTAIVTVTISKVELSSKPTISLTSVDGGIFFEGQLPQVAGKPGLSLTLTVSIALDMFVGGQTALGPIGGALAPQVLTDTTMAIADVQFSTTIKIAKQPGQELQVKTTGIVPKMSGLSIKPLQNTYVDLGDLVVQIPVLGNVVSIPMGTIPLDSLVGPLGDLIGNFASPLLDALVPLLATFLGPVLDGPASDAIKSVLESVEIDQDIDLPALLGNGGATMKLLASLSTVLFKPSGGTLGLRTGAWSEKAVDYDPLGSLLRDACMGAETGDFTFSEQTPMSVALHMDLLNELVHAVWWNGFFDMAAGPEELAELSEEVAKYGVQDLALTFLLPPVLTDCNAKGLLRLQIGDGFVQVKMNFLGLDVEAEMFVTMELDANIKASGNEVGITVNGVTLFQVHIVKVSDTFKGNEAALEDAIKALLLPQIEKLAGDSLGAFPIPALDLSGVVPGVPPGTELKLGDLSVGKSKGFISLNGDLE